MSASDILPVIEWEEGRFSTCLFRSRHPIVQRRSRLVEVADITRANGGRCAHVGHDLVTVDALRALALAATTVTVAALRRGRARRTRDVTSGVAAARRLRRGAALSALVSLRHLALASYCDVMLRCVCASPCTLLDQTGCSGQWLD